MLLFKGVVDHLQPTADALYGWVIHAISEDIGTSEAEILDWLNLHPNLPSLEERADCAWLASQRAHGNKQFFYQHSRDILDASATAAQHNQDAIVMLMGVFGVILDHLMASA